jgi:signal recognition particle GTPase
VLTKLDGTAKGGVAVAIRERSEAADSLRRRRRSDSDDLVPFDAPTYVDALFVDKW